MRWCLQDEGNELFKDGNYQHAVQRYTKALGHTGKFFDISDADKAEIDTMKVSLFLNLAQCYIKLEMWSKVCLVAFSLHRTGIISTHTLFFARVHSSRSSRVLPWRPRTHSHLQSPR